MSLTQPACQFSKSTAQMLEAVCTTPGSPINSRMGHSQRRASEAGSRVRAVEHDEPCRPDDTHPAAPDQQHICEEDFEQNMLEVLFTRP